MNTLYEVKFDKEVLILTGAELMEFVRVAVVRNKDISKFNVERR